MKYLSVCSGIEAATAAWHGLGWTPVAFSEIEKFPSAVLAHHYPNAPNWGDMTKFKEWPNADVDVLVGGTPCQSFSVAGLRKGLDDPRGNLMLTYLAIAERYRPEWLVWENVPGVLSSNGGRDFGSFLGGLGELGYGFAYRVLDAQYYGVAQRRRRVFVVANLRDWRRAAAVLFEQESLRGDSPPSREAGQEFAADAGEGAEGRCVEVADTLSVGANQTTGFHTEVPAVLPVLSSGQANAELTDNYSPALNCNRDGAPIVFKPVTQFGDVAGALTARHDSSPCADRGANMVAHSHAVATNMTVRRLTPVECERLQGFPDDYTAIPWRGKPAEDCPDGPRCKALGNSMAVPVMRWIGERIEMVRKI